MVVTVQLVDSWSSKIGSIELEATGNHHAHETSGEAAKVEIPGEVKAMEELIMSAPRVKPNNKKTTSTFGSNPSERVNCEGEFVLQGKSGVVVPQRKVGSLGSAGVHCKMKYVESEFTSSNKIDNVENTSYLKANSRTLSQQKYTGPQSYEKNQ